ncbi:MAG: MAC/perforin domain-containing protein [Terriglobia bacterium]
MTGEVFQVGGADLAPIEETKPVKEVAKGGKLSIKYTPLLGPTTPKPVLPPAPSTKVEWGQTVTYTSAGGATKPPAISGGSFDGKDQDEWSTLTWDQKRYIYSLLQLGRAIVMGPAASLRGAPGDSLVKSAKDTVWLMFPANGPDFTLPEKSFWGKFRSTFSLAAHEVHKRAATSVSAGGGVKGAALVSEFGMVEESTQHEQKSKLYNSQLFCKPVITLKVDVERDVKASEEFTEAIRETLDAAIEDIYPERTRYIRLLKVLGKYGHYLPVEFELGGAMGFAEIIEVDKNQTTTMKSFSSKGKVEATVKGVEVNTGFAREDSQQDKREFQEEKTTADYFMIGGDPSTYDTAKPGEWLKSLKKHTYWRVIGYEKSTPTIRFLRPDLLTRCIALLKKYAADPETARYTVLDMMQYALANQATLAPVPGHDIYD